MQEMPTPINILAGKPRLNALGEPIELGMSAAVLSALSPLAGRIPSRLGRIVNFNPKPFDTVWNFLARERVRVPMPTRGMTLDGIPMTPDQLYNFAHEKGTRLKGWIRHRIEAGAYENVLREDIQADLGSMSRRLTRMTKAAMVSGAWGKIPTTPPAVPPATE
jgi:hypothetical protein